MDAQDKQFLWTIILQVHPDKLTNHPLEQLQNTESLKVLNDYIDRLSRGEPLSQQHMEFCIVAGEDISTIKAVLPASGSLGPLFHAFGLTSEAERAHHTTSPGDVDVPFLTWLAGIVSHASKLAEEHRVLRAKADGLSDDIQNEFKLSMIIATGPTSLKMTDQQQHLEALGVLQQCLSELCQDQPDMLAGLCVFLHHPDNKSWWGSQGSFVEDNGNVTLIADPKTLRNDLLRLDLDEAQHRQQLSSMWAQKVSDQAAALTDLLGVQEVMFWSSKQPAREIFVHWADKVLEHRCADEGMMQRKTHSFNLLVQADSSLPLLHYDDLLGLLEVSTDCSPEQLLEYLQGEAATAASTAAVAQGRARQEEEELLEAASKALGTAM
ncbi:hypothetical protein ABBQ38_007635 [Trebouxia sp. C0009 RCD-2024]